jgi:DNA-binding transcriptional MerR regulator
VSGWPGGGSVLKVGEFSKLGMVSVSSLRYYDKIDLLKPDVVDPVNGYRLYRASQLRDLNRIIALKDLGLALEEIPPVLADELSGPELRGMLRLKQAEIRHHIDEEQERLQRVAVRLSLIEKEGTMPDTEVTIKTLESAAGLSVRETVAAAPGIGDVIGDAIGGIFANGLQLAGAPVAIYHDLEFTPDSVDIEVFCPVAELGGMPLETPGGRKLVPRTLEATEVAATVFVGSYEELATPYQALAAWIGEHGYRVAGPTQEIYMSRPEDPGPPVTEIRMPITRE